MNGAGLSLMWAGLGTLLALATLPGTLELLLLTIGGLLPPRRRGDGRSAGSAVRLAVVVPAHNEESGIARCVAGLSAAAREAVGPAWDNRPDGPLAIVVVADNCADATAARAREAGARVLERTDTERRGKGYALEFAFGRLLAEGYDAVAVVDADTVVEPNVLAAMCGLLAEGADAVQTRYGVLNAAASLRTRLMNVALLAFNVLRPRGRERWGLSVGIFGNGFALARGTLAAVPYDAHSVVEDLEYHLRLVRAGRAVRFADAATVRADMPVGGRGVETQRARWEGGRFRMIIDTVPMLAGAVVRGQWRLLEPLFELLLLPLAFHVALLVLTALVPFAPSQWYALAAIALVALHVVAGIVVGGGSWRDLAALAVAPAYVVWKLALAPAIARASRRKTEWVRTERHTSAEDRR